jgi:hypothetical protein
MRRTIALKPGGGRELAPDSIRAAGRFPAHRPLPAALESEKRMTETGVDTETVATEEPCWIARRLECGHIVCAAVIARRDFGVSAGRYALKWRAEGLIVERAEAEAVRTGDWCTCPRNRVTHRVTKAERLAAEPAFADKE